MYYVYLLKNDNKLSVDYSKDLKRRLIERSRGKVYTSSRMKEPKLIYYEAYNDIDLAKEKERKLKQYDSAYHGLLKRLELK